MIFINLENIYYNVLREILWKILERKRARITYIQIIKDMYDGVINMMT